MMSFGVLLLCAVSVLMVGSTLNPAKEMNTEDEVSNQMSKSEERLLLLARGEMAEEVRKIKHANSERFGELSSKLEQVLTRLSDIEKASQMSIDALTDGQRNEKDKPFAVNNDLLLKVLDLQKKDLETFEAIANVQKEARSDRVRADMIQVQINETANMTHSCLASQAQIQVTMQKNIERLDLIEESNLPARMGNVENLSKTLRQDLSYVSNRRDDTLELTVQNNTNDIGQLKQEIYRVQTICRPPCENGGQCVKNVCNCTPFFTGDSCQQVVCSLPWENGGQRMRNNTCKCTSSSYGDRCQNGSKCGSDSDNGGNNGGGNMNSVLVWPWMAAVYKNWTYGPKYICGGSIIHRHFVLTSAWCVKEYRRDGLSVKLGLSDLKNGSHLQQYRVQSTHMHPEFDLLPQNNFDYNIGLLELEEPIPFSPFVGPVCLAPPEIPQDELFHNSTVKAVYLDEYLSSPQTVSPTMFNHTILSQDECRRKMQETHRARAYPSPELSFCAETSTTCPLTLADFGSPLMQSRLAGDGASSWTQVGIISGCGDAFIRSPRLDHLRAWVDSKIAASSET